LLHSQEDLVMKARISAARSGWVLPLLALGLGAISWAVAQEPRERPRGEEPAAETSRQRERNERRGDAAPGDRAGTPEGMPQTRIAPPDEDRRRLLPRRWVLGVHAYNTENGVVVTRVVPGSGASEVGLEERDRIVTVDGFQVGNVAGQLYLLGDELQHRAGSQGRVRLLVQNWRDNELVNLDVRLRRDDVYYPAPRER
jgi:hypothetical protein